MLDGGIAQLYDTSPTRDSCDALKCPLRSTSRFNRPNAALESVSDQVVCNIGIYPLDRKQLDEIVRASVDINIAIGVTFGRR